jgi:hypothetical protein
MKRTILGILFIFSLHCVSGQNISRRAISAGGGYFSNSDINVSSTLGETFTATIGSGLVLSQGFQQKASVDSGIYLNLTAFIQGFYIGGGLMNSSLGDPLMSNIADLITVELHDTIAGHPLSFSGKGSLHTDGTASILFSPLSIGKSYYIVLKQRNSVETWSATPVLISNTGAEYNFSDATNKAAGDNLADLGDGHFAVFSGDITQDGSVDFNDYPPLDFSSNNGDLGYYESDLNGDTSVDFNDYPILEINSNMGIIVLVP